MIDMNRIKTYVINLFKDQERRESILRETSQYSTLDIEIVEFKHVSVINKTYGNKSINNYSGI